MIINLRGTHGSGKSTVVRTIIDRYDYQPLGGGRRPDGYAVNVPWLDRPLYVVGPYLTACGGCDGIQPYSDIWPRVERYATLGHVLFEGALISTTYGSIGTASETYGDEFVFAFLDTPVDVCVTRVESRRTAKGNFKPLDPTQVVGKHKTIDRLRVNLETVRGRRVIVIDYRRAVPQLLGVLHAG